MLNRIAILMGLVLAFMPAAVTAKGKTDGHLQSLLACRAITPDSARLQCLDQALATLSQSMQEGEVRLETDNRPSAMAGVVKTSGPRGESNYWIQLENGDEWLLLPSTHRKQAPQPGTTIQVRRSFLDSAYWIAGTGWPESRARFLGRGK
jgi:coenzyme F420-reducing hydrogenase alpha subunit